MCVLSGYAHICIIKIKESKTQDNRAFLKRRISKWHFQIFTDGTTKLKILLRLPAALPAEPLINRKKNPLPAALPAVLLINRKKNPLPAALLAVPLINRKKNLLPAVRHAALPINNQNFSGDCLKTPLRMYASSLLLKVGAKQAPTKAAAKIEHKAN